MKLEFRKIDIQKTMRLYFLALFVSVVGASKVDEECSGRCCTLKIFRPVGDDDKYSGTYSLNEGIYVMEGNSDITIEVIDSDIYDEEEEDYVIFENWGIMDASLPRWQRNFPVIEGGISGEDPVGNWPSGGEAKCLKQGDKGVCDVLQYTHAKGENGIYEEMKDFYGTEFGWRMWKQAGSVFWYFSFNEEADTYNVHEGGFKRSEEQDYLDDYSEGKSGGTLEGEWTDGTVIECVGED